MNTTSEKDILCSHCGEICPKDPIREGDRVFCCEGCLMVYQLLDSNRLCNYYPMNAHPGINRRMAVRTVKFAFLDDVKIASGLVSFHVTFRQQVRKALPYITALVAILLILRGVNPGIPFISPLSARGPGPIIECHLSGQVL